MTAELIAGTLWSALAVLNGKLAESNGDRGFKWFLMSVPLGPLATALLLARPRVKGSGDEALSIRVTRE